MQQRVSKVLIINILVLLAASVFTFAASAAEATPVVTTKPKQSSVSESLNLSGSLTAERQTRLSPRVDGLVKEVLVDAGSRVKQGEVLLRLDPAIAALEYAQAQAATAEALAAKNEAARLVSEAQRLRKQNHISESELANRLSGLALASAALSAATAAEKAAQEQLLRHDLPAPFTGVISAKMTEAGEWINRGDAVLELVGLDNVRLDVKAPQERFADIDENTEVSVMPDAMPGIVLTGRVTARVPVSDPQARAFLVRVQISGDEVDLLPGTSATARFRLNGGETRLLVPRDALLLHPDGGYSVFVVKDGVAQRRQVSVGKQGPAGIVILSGIDADEPVVIRGNEVLRDQQAVVSVDARSQAQ